MWEDNIKMDHTEVGCEVNLTQDRNQWQALVNTLMSLRVP